MPRHSARKSSFGWVGRDFFLRRRHFFPCSDTKDGGEWGSGRQQAREHTSVAEQTVVRGGVRDLPRMRVSAALCTLSEHAARISGIKPSPLRNKDETLR